jgi:hypothetical protein
VNIRNLRKYGKLRLAKEKFSHRMLIEFKDNLSTSKNLKNNASLWVLHLHLHILEDHPTFSQLDITITTNRPLKHKVGALYPPTAPGGINGNFFYAGLEFEFK